MSLKSIRDSYVKLLNTFDAAGIKLNENQKSDLDGFVLAIESTMSKQRISAIRKTKKAVTAKLENEFKQVFESIMDKMHENNSLLLKIQKTTGQLTENKKLAAKVSKYLDTHLAENKKLAAKVSEYLDMHVESILPKKTIVDYAKLKKLEKMHESMRGLLTTDNAVIAARKKQLDESFKSIKSKCETEVAKMQVKLNESNAKINKLVKQLNGLKAVELLESKTKDLPSFEAHAVKEMLSESTVSEIEEKFDDALNSVKKNAKKIAKKDAFKDESLSDEDASNDEKSLNEEIQAIMSDDSELEEDDPLKSDAHNGNAVHNGHLPENEFAEADDPEEEFETIEMIKEDEDGNVNLDESEVIDPRIMKFWCAQAVEVS